MRTENPGLPQLPVIIRTERAEDHGAVEGIHRTAFGGETEWRLVHAIRQAHGFDPLLSLVALGAQPHRESDIGLSFQPQDAVPVGHVLLSPVDIQWDTRRTTALALAPMAVLPACQRRGIGTKLVKQGLSTCRSRGHSVVIVLGHPEFYTRLGFRRASEFGIFPPFPVPDEVFMAQKLRPGPLDGARGVVRYPSHFSAAAAEVSGSS